MLGALASAFVDITPSAAETLGLEAAYAEAKKEGVVRADGPWSIQQMAPVISAFETRYAGVKVSYKNQPGPQTTAQLVTEAAAGRITLDAPGIYLPSIQPLLDRDLLLAFDGWSKLGVPDNLVQLDGRYVHLHDSPTVIAYNTDLVKPADIPRSWTDLLDPRWKNGKLILDSRGYFIIGLVAPDGLGEEAVLKIAAGLKSQNPLFVSRNATALDQLASGQAPIASAPLSFLIGKRASGAPVALAPISPVCGSTFGSAIAKNARNPNAAKLWVAWLASPEARKLLDVGGIGFADPCGGTPMGSLLCEAKVKLVSQRTLADANLEMLAQAKVAEALGTRAN